MWQKEVLNEQKEGYLSVVVFRSLVEKESPSVTIYLANIKTKGISFEDYVTNEIEEVVNDQNLTLIDLSEVVITNRRAIKLIDSESNGYKRMVHWISSRGVVFELSYESIQSEYHQHLDDVDIMINSFALDSPNEEIKMTSTPLQHDYRDNHRDNQEDPLMILKRRFAKGEVSEEEFKRMRDILRD